MGLPGSGKTELCKRLVDQFKDAVHLNADKIREEYNDWDFSEEGRLRQSRRMCRLADDVIANGQVAIADFVCPTEETRKQFNPDMIVWMNTIEQGRFEDTNKVFVPPGEYDVCFNNFADVNPASVVQAMTVRQSSKRKLAKALTWRLLGTIAMTVAGYILFNDVSTALYIGAADLTIKLGLFYVHETIWDRVSWGSITKNQQH